MELDNSDFFRQLHSFDADFSPSAPVNRQAADERGLTFDVASQCYVDDDGCLILDAFGQPL